VPEVLLSGDFGKIEKWRDEKAMERTIARRPDLLKD
jgi:tRNA (guanine37-N1)-methyltransferase